MTLEKQMPGRPKCFSSPSGGPAPHGGGLGGALVRDVHRIQPWLQSPLRASVLAAAVLLASCGGGTAQVEAFKPNRLIAFGDESSLLEDFVDTTGVHDGFKYGINDRSSGNAGKCLVDPTVAQLVASHYGFVFSQCNPNTETPRAFIQAQRLATVDDPSLGLAQQRANLPDLGPKDMTTVMIGSNDIIELYERTLIGMTRAEAVAEAQRRGGHAAEQVNAILATGARALVMTVPNLGVSPYAATANQTNPGASALLNDLTVEFNAYLRTRIDSAKYDGRNYGLVLADDIVSAMARTPASFLNSPAITNAAACHMPDVITADSAATAALACDSSALVSGAVSASHLWATDRHLGPNAHNRIGSQAASRASSNPF